MAENNKKKCKCKNSELELSLIESEEKFRLLMELATDGVLVVQNGKIKEVNYYLAKMCGYTIDEVLDTDLASFFHTDDVETIETIYEKPLSDDNALAVHELTLMCKNGYKIDVEVIAGRFVFQISLQIFWLSAIFRTAANQSASWSAHASWNPLPRCPGVSPMTIITC